MVERGWNCKCGLFAWWHPDWESLGPAEWKELEELQTKGRVEGHSALWCSESDYREWLKKAFPEVYGKVGDVVKKTLYSEIMEADPGPKSFEGRGVGCSV